MHPESCCKARERCYHYLLQGASTIPISPTASTTTAVRLNAFIEQIVDALNKLDYVLLQAIACSEKANMRSQNLGV